MRRLPAIVAPLLLVLAACPGGAGRVADPGAPADAVDGTPAEVAGDAPPPDDLPALPEAPALPPCYRACDRVVACGVEACAGYDWSTAGALYEGCFERCDEARATAVLARPGCPEVLGDDALVPDGFAATCASNPCQVACDRLGSCFAAQCEGIDEALGASISTDCRSTCQPADVAWILDPADCAALVGGIVAADPAVAELCHPPPPGTCADAASCDAYAAKATGCIVAHCGGNADPWAAGLEAVVDTYCATAQECPAPAVVAALVAPNVTCDDPAFASLGRDPPFIGLCEGTLGIGVDRVRTACEHLMACPGLEAIPGVDGCMVYAAMWADVAARVACLEASTACPDLFACLEGL